MIRILFWAALVGGLVLLAVLFLAYLNGAVALDDARQQVRYQQQTIETLRGMLDDVSRHVDRATIARLVERRADSSHVVKRDGDSMSLDEIVFVFEGNKVSAVRLLHSGGSGAERR